MVEEPFNRAIKAYDVRFNRQDYSILIERVPTSLFQEQLSKLNVELISTNLKEWHIHFG